MYSCTATKLLFLIFMQLVLVGSLWLWTGCVISVFLCRVFMFIDCINWSCHELFHEWFSCFCLFFCCCCFYFAAGLELEFHWKLVHKRLLTVKLLENLTLLHSLFPFEKLCASSVLSFVFCTLVVFVLLVFVVDFCWGREGRGIIR